MDISNVPKSSPVHEILIQAAIGMALAGDSTTLQVATKPFHRECPVTPNWAPSLDTVCNVEEAMDWKGTDWEAVRVILVVDPDCHQCHNHIKPGDSLPFILLNPFPETCLKLLDLRCRDLKLYTDAEEADQLNEVGEVVRLLELVS